MTNWDIINQDEAKQEGKNLAEKHLTMINDAIKSVLTPEAKDERKIYELSVKQFKELMVECYEIVEQRKLDTSMQEYKRLTTKTIVEDLNDGRKIVPQEY